MRPIRSSVPFSLALVAALALVLPVAADPAPATAEAAPGEAPEICAAPDAATHLGLPAAQSQTCPSPSCASLDGIACKHGTTTCWFERRGSCHSLACECVSQGSSGTWSCP